jgi:hypothetical protein
MKISGPSGTGAAAGPRGVRTGADGAGFSLPAAEGAAGRAPASSVSSLTGVMAMDALLALQDVGGPLERKKRAVRRAGHLLDVLEQTKLALLDGNVSGADLDRLQRALRDVREQTDDPKLEVVLDEIELRAAVEIAKLEKAGNAA